MWPPRRSDAQVAALIVAAVFAAYATAFRGTFQFDDWNVIVRDPRVQSLSSWWAAMPGIRPLLKLTYAVNNGSGLGLAGFHAFNIAVHAVNAWLVRALLLRLAVSRGSGRDTAGLISVTGALLFALHPVQTEAVTYISGRSTSLAACFALASVVSWLAGRDANRTWQVFVLSPTFLAAALATKEYVAVVPFALLLIERTDPRRPARLVTTLAALTPHAILLAGGFAAALASPTYRQLLATSLETRSPGANLLTQVNAVFYLAGQLVRIDRLSADPQLPVRAIWTPLLALQAAILVALFVAALALLRARPAFALGTLWFFLWLAPTNSLLARLDVANDRQLYLALVGPVWLLAVSCSGLRRRTIVVCTAVLALTLGGVTARRNLVYASEISFWEDVAEKNPHNARAFNNLGYAYALACRRHDAESAFRKSIELHPSDFHAGVNLRLLLQDALPGVDEACGGVR